MPENMLFTFSRDNDITYSLMNKSSKIDKSKIPDFKFQCLKQCAI